MNYMDGCRYEVPATDIESEMNKVIAQIHKDKVRTWKNPTSTAKKNAARLKRKLARKVKKS